MKEENNKIMTLDEVRKVRKLLGNDYHLSIEMDCLYYETGIRRWVLYKNYDDPIIYFSPDNGPIMSSDTNTYEELLEFAKKHHRYDENKIISKFRLILSYIAILIALINFFCYSPILLAIAITIDIVILLECFISLIIVDHNCKVSSLELFDTIQSIHKKREMKKEGNEKC